MGRLFGRIIKSYFQTIVEIIEDKPNFIIPLPLYSFLIIVFFLQLSGYVFTQDQLKYINDQQFLVLSVLNEISTGTYLLNLKGNDTLTLVIFAIVQIIIYFYYFYVGILTFLRSYKKEWLEVNQHVFKYVNQILNSFFTFYYWVFQIPSLEINIQMLSCNVNSFLTDYKTQEQCKDKPIYYIFFASIGSALTIITGLVVLYFFRNYQFNETNLLKRIFSFLQVIQLVFFFAFMFFYYINDSEQMYFSSIQVIGVVQVIDLIYNTPYQHDFINLIYSFFTCYFEISMLILTIWSFTNILKPYEVLFLIFIFTSLFFFVIRSLQINKYLSLTYIDFRTKSKEDTLNYLNSYLELMFKLANEQNKNEVSKFKIFEMLNLHVQQCDYSDCICKISNFKDKKDNLYHEDVFILIEQLFQRNLKINLKNIDRQKIEYTYLKYITYLTRVRNRPTKAYYELKQYISNQQNFSFYFDLIQSVLSANIEKVMTINQKVYHKTKIVDNYQETVQEDLDLLDISKTEEIKKLILPELTKYLSYKLTFWRQLLEGNYNLSSFSELATSLAYNSRQVQKLYERFLSNISPKVNISSNIVLSKIIEIYKCTVSSDFRSAYKFSSLFASLLNRDIQRSYFILNCYNIIKGDVQIIKTSLSNNHGKILNEKSERLANFFGYSLKDFHQINNINDLMPRYISQIHNNFINNLVQRGFSPIIQDKIMTFIKNKDGFIEPVNIYLQNHQTIENDFCLQAILLKLVSPKEYIVFDDQGFIQGVTEKVFNALFRKREKYEGLLKQLFHSEGPYPIMVFISLSIIFCDLFNSFHLLKGRKCNRLRRVFIKIQYLPANSLDDWHIKETQIDLIICQKYLSIKEQITLEKNSYNAQFQFSRSLNIFVPLRIFHLNNVYSNGQNTPSHSFQKKGRGLEHTNKSNIEIEQFLLRYQNVIFFSQINCFCKLSKLKVFYYFNQIQLWSDKLFQLFISLKQQKCFVKFKQDYKEEQVYSQLAVVFNLSQRVYSYQDQNQQNILNKTIYVLEILEKTDLTTKNLKQDQKIEQIKISSEQNQKSESNIKSQLKLFDAQIQVLSASNYEKNQLSMGSTHSFRDVNQNQIYFDTQQEGESPVLSQKSQILPRFKQVESQQTLKRFSEPQNKIEQFTILQNQLIHNQQNNERQNGSVKKQQSNKSEKNNLFVKQKFQSLNNFSSLMNNNLTIIPTASSQKNFSVILNGENSIKQQNEIQTNRIKDESKIDLFSEHKLISKIPQSDLNHQQILFSQDNRDLNENDILFSINSNRMTTARDKNLLSQEDGINQQNIYTILSPRQIQSNELLMSSREHQTFQNQKSLNQSKQRIEKIRESLNFLKKDSLKSILNEDDLKSSGERVKWNKLFGDAKKITKLDVKKQQNESSISEQEQKKHIPIKKHQQENAIIAERASQSVTSLGSKLNSFSQQLIYEILKNNQITNKLIMLSLFSNYNFILIFFSQMINILIILLKQTVIFLGSVGMFSLIFNERVQIFLNDSREDLVSCYTLSFSQIISANLTNTAYYIHLMDQSTPIIDQTLIKSLKKQEISSCLFNGIHYHRYIEAIFNIIYNYAHIYPGNSFHLEVFSNKQGHLTPMKYPEGYWLYSDSALSTCQLSTSQPQQFMMQLEGLFFMLSNFIMIYEQSFTIISEIIDKTTARSTDLINSLEIIFFCSIGLSSFCFIIILYVIKRISFYKEKVLLLVSRISYSEIEKEVTKLENCLKFILNVKEDWTRVDFIDLMTKDSQQQFGVTSSQTEEVGKEAKQMKILKSNQKVDQNTNQVKLIVPSQTHNILPMVGSKKSQFSNSLQPNENKIKSSNQKQKILSSSFTKRNLFNFKQIIIGGSFFTSGCLFIGIGLLIAKSESNNFEMAITFYFQALDYVKGVSSVIVLSQILLSQLFLEYTSPQFPKSDFTKSFLFYQEQLQNLQKFESSFLQDLSSQTQIQNFYKNEIFDLFQKDFCQKINENSNLQFNSFIIYQLQSTCKGDSQANEYVKNGIVGIVNQYIHYGTSLIEFLKTANWSTDSQGAITKMKSILNSSTHTQLITLGFNAPLSAITSLIDVLNTAYRSRSDKYIKVFEIYFLVLGPILGLITFILIVIYSRKINNDLKDVNFTLTLIPYGRLLDENTIIMLKLLKKYQ